MTWRRNLIASATLAGSLSIACENPTEPPPPVDATPVITESVLTHNPDTKEDYLRFAARSDAGTPSLRCEGDINATGEGLIEYRQPRQHELQPQTIETVCSAIMNGESASETLYEQVPARPVHNVEIRVLDTLSEQPVASGSMQFSNGREVEINQGLARLLESDSVYVGEQRIIVPGTSAYWGHSSVIDVQEGTVGAIDVIPRTFDIDKFYEFTKERFRPDVVPTIVVFRDVYEPKPNPPGYRVLMPNDTLTQADIDAMKISDQEKDRIWSVVQEDLPQYLPFSPRVVWDDEMHADSVPDLGVRLSDRGDDIIMIYRATNVPQGWAIARGSTHYGDGYVRNAMMRLQLPRMGFNVGRRHLAADLNESFGWGHIPMSPEVENELLWYLENPDGSRPGDGRPRQLVIDQGKVLYSDLRKHGSEQRTVNGQVIADYVLLGPGWMQGSN